MIKAVFFDLYHTLVRYEPPREELQSKALKELGIEAKPEALGRPIAAADEFIYREIARQPLTKRSDEDKMALWMQYQRVFLKEAGIPASEQLVLGLLGKMRRTSMKLVAFEDAAPALADLKSRGLILGLISNVDKDVAPLLAEVGLASLLQIIVTSQEVGFSKPQPEIFRAALKRAGVKAAEAIFVGDQYKIDVEGARGVGMKGILLDRAGYAGDVDSPRIRNLSELAGCL